MPRQPSDPVALLLCALAACSYDGSGVASLGVPTSTTTTATTTATGPGPGPTSSTTTAPTTTGATSTSTGTTSPIDPTTGTTGGGTTTTGGTTTGTGTTGPDTTGTTDTTESGTTDSGTTTTGTTGDPPASLVDDGLIVRYYLDETMDGQISLEAGDDAPQPLHLPFTYIMGGAPNPVYDAVDGNRGLRWPATKLDGRATVPIDGTKVQTRLEMKTTATVELVLMIDNAAPEGSRIVHTGAGNESGWFSVRTSHIHQLDFYKDNILAGSWSVDWAARGRTIAHVVFDSGQDNEIHRVRLYLDGSAVPDADNKDVVHPLKDAQIAIPTTGMGNKPVHFTLGNRGVDADRSFEGVLFYAAIYDQVLSEPEIANNAAVLAESDDKP